MQDVLILTPKRKIICIMFDDDIEYNNNKHLIKDNCIMPYVYKNIDRYVPVYEKK